MSKSDWYTQLWMTWYHTYFSWWCQPHHKTCFCTKKTWTMLSDNSMPTRNWFCYWGSGGETNITLTWLWWWGVTLPPMYVKEQPTWSHSYTLVLATFCWITWMTSLVRNSNSGCTELTVHWLMYYETLASPDLIRNLWNLHRSSNSWAICLTQLTWPFALQQHEKQESCQS